MPSLLTNQQTIADLKRDWKAVRALCSVGSLFWGRHGEAITNRTPDQYFNLPFFMAYAVLDQCLDAMISEGLFSCRDRRLGPKMIASCSAIQWIDFAVVNKGRDGRNDLAHEAILASKADCFKYIDAIELELNGWGAL